jgi:CRP-like cAMP-binding protein
MRISSLVGLSSGVSGQNLSRSSDYMNRFSTSVSSELASISATRTFKQQDRFPTDSRFLWKIERGIVRTVTWNKEGISSTLGFWGPGDVVGEPLSQTDPYEVECLESVAARALPIQFWVHELDAILLSAQQTENLLNIISHQTVSLRLLELLTWLAHKFGYEVETGRLIMVKLTHQVIAETVRSTRVTVTRALGSLEQEGKIIRSGHQLILSHPYSTFHANTNERKLRLTSTLKKIEGENYEYIS